MFDLQPNSVVQGLDILEEFQGGSVSVTSRQLLWGEIDHLAPGMTPDSGLVFGRRYFSELNHDGRGSTGARWVSSITERLIARTTANGDNALQHFSWLQPFNDPDYYYVETSPGSNVFQAGPHVGASIVKAGTDYLLTFKNGAVHKFSTFADTEVRVVYRQDPFGNTTNFGYDDPPQGYGYSAARYQSLDAADALIGTVMTITDSRGVVYTVNFDLAGYIFSIVGPTVGGVQFTIYFEYDFVGGVGYLVRVVYPQRQVLEPSGAIVTRTTDREFAYDANGRLGQILDDYGNVILQNTYDPYELGKVATQTDATGGVFAFSSTGAGATLTTQVITPRGWKRTYHHNLHGQVSAIRQYQANFASEPARTADPNVYYEWLFGRNHACACGPITTITEPDGGTVELTYSGDLDLTQVRKRSPDQLQQLVWKWTYDSDHRVATHIPPEGNAATDPAPHTITYARAMVAGNLVTTTTVPPRDGRTAPSVWTETADGHGRIFEMVGPPHSGTTPSFGGKWTFYTAGDGKGLPQAAYQFDSVTIAYSYVWDKLGRVTEISDDAQRTWTCTYDLEGRPLELTAPTINQSQAYTHKWFYDGNGRTVRLQWSYYQDDADTTPEWIEWNFTYDAAGRILTRTKQLDSASPTPAVATEVWTYDAQGNVTSATDADGCQSTVLYDERDLPWLLGNGVGTAEQSYKLYDYNADGRLVVIREQLDATRSVRFENAYDGLDRLSRYSIVDDANPTIVAGYVDTTYDAGSRVQEIATYSVSGTAPVIVDKKTFSYNDFHESPTGQISFVYELSSGAPIRAVQSDFDYGPSGRPIREWVAGTTLVAQYSYLPCGLPDEIADAHGNGMVIVWDQYGRALAEINTYDDDTGAAPLVVSRTFTRDQFGRATTITDSGSGVAAQSHVYVYDSCDNVVRQTRPDGSVQTYQYRFDGLATREDAVIAGSTVRAQQTVYTPGGRRHQVIDDRNNSVSFVYDGRGRLKQEVYPDGTTWTNLHNHAGLLTKITGPSGRTVDFDYDWRGMIAQTVYKDGLGVVQRTDAFDIDRGGFVKRVTRTEGGVTHYVDMLNDSTGRVLQETTEIPGLPQTTVEFGYDNLGRLQSILSPFGYEHTYTYDDRNRVKQVWFAHQDEGSWGTGNWNVANYDYLGTGTSVVRRTTGDGYTLNVSRDGFGRIARMETVGVADFQYGYDTGNRVNREFRALDGKGDAFWYDGLGRLTKTTRDSADPVAELATPQSTQHALHREYLMDGDAHRTQVRTTPMGGSVELTNYATHGTRHHYTQIQKVGQPAVSRSFDLDGRLTASGTRTFTYDISDNLIEVREGTTLQGQYTYDALGRRVTKFDGQGYETRYVHAGPWIIEDYRRIKYVTPWNLKGAYVHGPGIDNVVMMRHRDWADADTDWDRVEPRNFYLHCNKQGSTTEVVDQDGGIVERYRYDAYGKPTVLDGAGNVLSGAVCGNFFLFTGRELRLGDGSLPLSSARLRSGYR